jgi:hypothetical protein
MDFVGQTGEHRKKSGRDYSSAAGFRPRAIAVETGQFGDFAESRWALRKRAAWHGPTGPLGLTHDLVNRWVSAVETLGGGHCP